MSSAGFGHMTALLAAAAPLAVILEGGYNLEATAAGVEATMRVLLGERPAPLPIGTAPASRIAMMVIHEVIARQVSVSAWAHASNFLGLYGVYHHSIYFWRVL